MKRFKELFTNVVKEEKEVISEGDDQLSMVKTQLHFIKYAAEEILQCAEMRSMELPEWYQNNLTKVYTEMESLHSYMEGTKRKMGVSEETEVDLNENSQGPTVWSQGGFRIEKVGEKYVLYKGDSRVKGFPTFQMAKNSIDKDQSAVPTSRVDEEKSPCWKGYEMVGMKKKGGKEVPNCVPIKKSKDRYATIKKITKESVQRYMESKNPKIKEKKEGDDKFQADPTLSSEIMKEDK